MKRKSFSLHFVRVSTDEEAAAIIKSMARRAIQKVLDKHGAASHNLDEILDKYITVKSREG